MKLHLDQKSHSGDADLDCICTSLVTDMNRLFENKTTNQDISSWDTSNVTNMRAMFKSANVSSTLNNWNTSNVSILCMKCLVEIQGSIRILDLGIPQV